MLANGVREGGRHLYLEPLGPHIEMNNNIMSFKGLFMVLPLNVTNEAYPNNKIGYHTMSFPNELPTEPGQWEVALAEITFPLTFFNITQVDLSVAI